MFHIPSINLTCKMYKQSTNLNIMTNFYLKYVYLHVSASNPAIFSVTIQEYNCSYMCHHLSVVLKIYIIWVKIVFVFDGL